jgi:HK97 family phage prohead protease
MPWTVDDPPSVAKNWTDEEKEKCVKAANAVLEDGGTDEEAIFACIHAAGKSEESGIMSKNSGSLEKRYVPAELRIDEEGYIEGYGAVFDVWSQDLGGFRERVRKGAFSKTLHEADIRGLFNHNSDYVLGRNKAGTLTLGEDDHGLKFRVKPPQTQWANDLQESIRRGDIDQASFAFNVIKDEWTRGKDGDLHERELIEVKLFDVSVVTYPAYPQTSVTARSMAEHLNEAASEPSQEGHSEEGPEDPTEARALAERWEELRRPLHGLEKIANKE